MRLTAQTSMIIAIIFAIVCFVVAITGFRSLRDITDPQQISDAKGFAFFWTFMGGVGALVGFFSWWLLRTSHKE